MRLLVALLLAVASLAAAAHAQPLRSEIYYRVEAEPRPGGDAVVAFFLGYLEDGEPRPIPDAAYSAHVVAGGRLVELPVTVSGGIAYVRVRVPLEQILGGSLMLNLSASSESRLIRSSRLVTLSHGPDYAALAVLALALVPTALAVAIVLRGRRW